MPTNIRVIDKIAMFLLGAINNLPYVVGVSSADRIVASYHNSTYLGLVLWATVGGTTFSIDVGGQSQGWFII